MENIGNIILGIMIPFAGTTLGAACVYFMKKGIRQNVEKGLLGFAAGVEREMIFPMIAGSRP